MEEISMKFAFALASLVFAVALPAGAAEYPDHPVKMVVAYPPGGATDVMARAVAQRLGDRLKQSVVVDNRPGASGQIGSDVVAKAAPDGYTIILTAADTHSINPHVYPKIAYDAKRDFVPVAMVGYLPLALMVNPSVKASNLKEFIALAKASPGKLTYASYGLGSSSQVAMEMLAQHEKISLLHVPFQGAAPALTAVMGGQVDAMMVPLTVAWPNHQSGKVRVLAVAAPKRFVAVPDVPTFAEQGVALVSAPWIGVLAPAKTPADIVDKLSREVAAVAEDPQVQETLVKNGLQPDVKKAPEFKTFLDAEYDLWGATIKAANIKSE
jgi:tripartite-type tricarboxylate transporter receptor subunit TctC